jgi:hypothetical protein
LPSQRPSVPQVAEPWLWHVPCGSVAPFATFVHAPIEPARPHDSHEPLQLELQQTPCAQNFDRHSVLSAQVLPRPLRPHDPLMHTAGDAQSASAAQAPLQTEAPHLNGKHELAAGVTHAPLPSHVEAGVNVVVAAGQVEPAQAVPFAYFWHAPAWHLPFVPQVGPVMSVHRPAGSEFPVGTLVHVPSVPDMAHD